MTLQPTRGLISRALRHALAFLALAFLAAAASAQTLTVVSWNVESGGSDDQTIRTRMASFEGVDLWGLSEVASPTWRKEVRDREGAIIPE